MYLIFKDISWMSWNVLLALIPVFFGWLMTKAHTNIGKFVAGFIWLVFLPNTIYLLTDIIHFSDDLTKGTITDKTIIFGLYSVLMVLGIITFVLSLHPLEKIFKKRMKHKTSLVYGLNFIIGFGIVLGRIERTNSWDIVTNFPRFMGDVLHVLTSPEKIIISVAFGLLCNIVYFSCRKLVMQEVHEIEKL